MTDKPTYEELEQRVQELEQTESERKQMAESMRSLNEHLSFYRNAVGSMEDYKIAVVGPDYRYRIVSPQYLKIYNLTGAEIVGRTVAEIMGDDVFEHAIKPNLDLAMEGLTVHYSDLFELSDKGKRYLEVSYYPVIDDDQEVVSVIAISHDLTEKRRVDEALRESEKRFQKMLGVVPDMISIHSPEMDILHSNWQGFAAIPEAKRVLNTKCYKTYRGLDFVCPDCRAKTVLETRKPFHEEALLPDGTWVDLHVIPILDKDNNVEMFIELVRNISDWKRSGKELVAQKVRLESLFINTSDAIVFIDSSKNRWGCLNWL